MIFVGVDWAEAHHDVHVEDEEGRRLGGGRLPEGVEGIARFRPMTWSVTMPRSPVRWSSGSRPTGVCS
jgi:hypothetical protein